MCGVLNKDRKVIIGRTENVNNVETLVWERIDTNELDNTRSLLESAVEANITDHRIVEKMNCQLALTGKAYQILAEKLNVPRIQNLLKKCKVFGNMSQSDSKFLSKTLKEYSDSEYPLTYVHDGHGDLNFQ